MATSVPCCAIAVRISSSDASTTAIVPPGGSAAASRPRATTMRAASSSEKTPATHAAAYSPKLCPITAAGSMPHERQSAASAYSIAKSAGCAYSVRSVRSIVVRREDTSRKSGREDGRATTHARVERIAERRRRVVQRATHARVLRSLPREQKRDARVGRSNSRDDPRMLVARKPRIEPCGERSRAFARHRHADARSARVRCSPSRRDRRACRPVRPSTRATGHDIASRVGAALLRRGPKSRAPEADARRSSGPVEGDCSGASSSTTCAFVPLNPNELTPAMRRPSVVGHGVVVVGTTIGRVLPIDVRIRLLEVQMRGNLTRGAARAPP